MFNRNRTEPRAALSGSVGASIRQFNAVLLLSACLSAPSCLSAQEPQQRGWTSAEVASDAPSLRVTVRLVEANVIVNDKHGNPNAGLRQNDFSVLDNGKPQDITFFSTETNLPFATPRTPLPLDTFTNRPEELTTFLPMSPSFSWTL
jgi:hypothetical protein